MLEKRHSRVPVLPRRDRIATRLEGKRNGQSRRVLVEIRAQIANCDHLANPTGDVTPQCIDHQSTS